jgi:hypothetical protein
LTSLPKLPPPPTPHHPKKRKDCFMEHECLSRTK